VKLDITVGPSTNNLYSNLPGIGRVKSKAFKKWAKVAMLEMMAQRKLPLPVPPVCLTLSVPDSDGKGDISNRVKAVEDLLVKMGFIPEDNDKIIRKLVVEVGAPKGRCLIELTEYNSGRG
jgi:Holliday junction resolvase RusA-like endonuclease